jgi:hypothetical protein
MALGEKKIASEASRIKRIWFLVSPDGSDHAGWGKLVVAHAREVPRNDGTKCRNPTLTTGHTLITSTN